MAAVARLTQTITIVDKSNKVVGASKQLKNVFHEAKHAYLERKAEIKAQRKQYEERELQKAIEHMSVRDEEDTRSEISRSRTRRRRRRNSDEFSQYSHTETDQVARYSNSERCRKGQDEALSLRSHVQSTRADDSVSQTRSLSGSPVDAVPRNQLIRRSRTDFDQAPRPRLTRSYSTPDVDLDLAYGDFHHGDLKQLSRATPQDIIVQQHTQQKELNTLVLRCQGLLDEANCAQYSVRKIVSHLQGNPDAMAAVALTLAEISNMASKMAPGALAMFKTSAPAVMALLASPQFLIAVGVGIGVTVVMFGGYKIVKKIKESKASATSSQDNLAYGAAAPTGSMDEALDVRELDRIEMWRRGIADAHAEGDDRTEVSGYSTATYTSVEGEIITPFAASMGHLPLKSNKSKKDKDKKDKKQKRKKRDGSDESVAETKSSRGATVKVKKPSPLRKMFSGGTSTKS